MLQYLLVLVVLAIALYVISAPLLSARRASAIASDDVRALEAARDSKLQEIRDAEMDMRTGKLSDEDYRAIDGSLRSEAVQILERLDEALTYEDAVRAAEAAGEGAPGPIGDGSAHAGTPGDSADDRLRSTL
jgi:type II secretory pathway component PulM